MTSCCDTYCANHGCNQGRDCPVRISASKVARVGRKDYTKEALPPTVWRFYVRQLAKWMLIAVVLMTFLPFVMAFAFAKAKEPQIACANRILKDTTPAHIVLKCKGLING